MWYAYRDARKLDLDSEPAFFYDTYHEHEYAEGEADQVETWLCTCRPVLVLCKQRAKKAKSVRGDSDSVSSSESSMSSSSDEESAGSGRSVPEDFLARSNR